MLADDPLRLVDVVGLHVDHAVALHADVVVPGRPPERPTADPLQQVVAGEQLERRLPAAVEVAEDGARADHRVAQA
jgi:hypothetical protein